MTLVMPKGIGPASTCDGKEEPDPVHWPPEVWRLFKTPTRSPVSLENDNTGWGVISIASPKRHCRSDPLHLLGHELIDVHFVLHR
jgi:hypothetical protein